MRRLFNRNKPRRFRCPVCQGEFSRQAEIAVCNGINVKADDEGRPLSSSGAVLPTGARLELIGMNGEPVPIGEDGKPAPVVGAHTHRPVQMEVV